MKIYKKSKDNLRLLKLFKNNHIGLLSHNLSLKILTLFLLFFTGCPKPLPEPNPVPEQQKQTKLPELDIYAQYSVQKVDILPLTEFVFNENAQQVEINLFVSMLDSFGSEIKSPAVIRFELYTKVPRSVDSKGDRVILWPDIDLTNPEVNNQYWRNYLRAYEFNLPFKPQIDQPYILEVMCLCPNGKRISTEFTIQARNELFD